MLHDNLETESHEWQEYKFANRESTLFNKVRDCRNVDVKWFILYNGNGRNCEKYYIIFGNALISATDTIMFIILKISVWNQVIRFLW